MGINIDMTINLQLIVTISIQVISVVVFIMKLKSSIDLLQSQFENLKENLKHDLDRLEKKQDKHNNLITRMTVAEKDICNNTKSIDSAHNKIRHLHGENH